MTRTRKGHCPVCGDSDFLGLGWISHASWCTERGGDGHKPLTGSPSPLPPAEAKRLRALRTVGRAW